MLDEKKVKLMTKVAIYEKQEAHGGLRLGKYFKEDYVKYGCLKTIVVMTLCYWVIVAVYVMTNFDEILNKINELDYFQIVSAMMAGYVGILAIFMIYAFIVYNFKYMRVRKNILVYNKNLHRLLKLYSKEEEAVQKTKVKVYDGVGGEEL